ncbi:MAG: glycosyltransferase, partial [Erysipelotrichaceae bacterium]|nr:glycosyltransferase [Erysipelotrichaceae bacterium]
TGLWDAYFAFFGNNPGTIFFGFLSEPNSSEFLPAAQYPHNLYLSILFRWGLFGLFLFIGYIYSSYKIALEGKASSNKMAIGLTLILLFIFGMALDILFARAILYIYFAIFVVITAKPKSIGRPVTIDENDLKKENIIVELIPSLARGGAERFVASLAHSMSKTELVYVVTFYDDITEKNREIIANNENIKLVCLHKKRGLDFKFYDNLLWLIKSLKPKVIHTHIYALFNLLIATWSLRGLHIVHSVHNLAPNEAKHFRRILYYFAFKMKKVLPVAISISTKSSYEKYYHLSNIPLIYNGIDVDANVAPNTTRKNIMINVGRMTEQKNQLALVEAFEFFVTDNPHWELYIVGNGPLKEVIMERAKLLIAEGKLKILSDVENLNEVYNTCQAFVLPSIYEGNSIALLEAINYNLFIIATKVGAATEYLIPNVNGIFVSSPAMYDIYLALTKALPYLGKTNNQALLEKISIEKTASEYLSLFTQISEKKTKNKRHARV